jgi:hypothetical protein
VGQSLRSLACEPSRPDPHGDPTGCSGPGAMCGDFTNEVQSTEYPDHRLSTSTYAGNESPAPHKMLSTKKSGQISAYFTDTPLCPRSDLEAALAEDPSGVDLPTNPIPFDSVRARCTDASETGALVRLRWSTSLCAQRRRPTCKATELARADGVGQDRMVQIPPNRPTTGWLLTIRPSVPRAPQSNPLDHSPGERCCQSPAWHTRKDWRRGCPNSRSVQPLGRSLLVSDSRTSLERRGARLPAYVLRAGPSSSRSRFIRRALLDPAPGSSEGIARRCSRQSRTDLTRELACKLCPFCPSVASGRSRTWQLSLVRCRSLVTERQSPVKPGHVTHRL